MSNSRNAARIAVFVVLLVSGAYPQQKQARNYEGAIAASRAAMRELVANGDTPGASIAVAADGQLIWTEGFGYADVERRKLATAETQFGIGSITKALTTALFGLMVEKGIVGWDVQVQKYLPDFPHRDITGRMIAGHTSGLGDRFDNANRLTTRHYDTNAAMTEILKEPLRHAPGTAYYYGTSSYTVLAAVLERKTGRRTRDLMEAEVLDPLGMEHTIVNDGGAAPNPLRTVFHERTAQGKILPVPKYDPSFKLAGAGYLSTSADLARFGLAFLPGSRALSEKLKSEVLRPMTIADGSRPVTGMGGAMGFKEVGLGLGWNIAQDQKGRRVIHQPGGGPGISSWLIVYPDEGLVIAIVSNRTSAPVGGKALEITTEAFLEARSAGSSGRGSSNAR